MYSQKDTLKELLQKSTVKVTIPGLAGWGTGFFVTYDLVLTCAHVVQEKRNSIHVYWQNWQDRKELIEATIERMVLDSDLALLRLSEPQYDAPCVYLDLDRSTFPENEEAYLFGYPDKDYQDGCPVTVTCEGITRGNLRLIKFKSGQVRPGMSGSPILNLTSGKVFGMVKSTRDRSSDLGGDGISTAVIVQYFPELKDLHILIDQRPNLWRATLRIPKYVEEAKEIIFRAYSEMGYLNEKKQKYLSDLRQRHKLSEVETKEVEKNLIDLCKCHYNYLISILPTFEQEISSFFKTTKNVHIVFPTLKKELKDLGLSRGLSLDKIDEIYCQSLCNYIEKEMLSQNVEQAIAIYELSIKQQPDCERFHIGLGLSLSRDKQFKKAINAFLEAQRLISPKDNSTYNDLISLDELIQTTRNNLRNQNLRRILIIARPTIVTVIVFVFIKESLIIKLILIAAFLSISEILTRFLKFLHKVINSLRIKKGN